jgi:hypothetical protein
VLLPSFILSKSPMVKKKRPSEETANRLSKRFNEGSQRPLYHMERDSGDAEDQDEQHDDDWEDDNEPKRECESDWDSLAFE